MPRMAREKSGDSIYHVMARSISEVDLFKEDEDKYEYISKIKKYQEMHMFKIYCYCFMSNHIHLIIDANGADISTIMHSINFSYAQYFNKKYKRHGHLFQDRFKSKIIDSDRYLIAASAYIHNNVVGIPMFAICPEKYLFSSLGTYVGMRKDPFGLISDGFIKSMFGSNARISIRNYIKFVYRCDNKAFKAEIEFENEKTEYRNERTILVREFKIEEILRYVSNKMNIPEQLLYVKNCKEIVEAKAIAAMLMRCLCNFKCAQICAVFGNITQTRVSGLCCIGADLVQKEPKYSNMINDFIKTYTI